MISVGSFCIDTTEVTSGQYRAFVVGDASSLLPPSCSFKTTITSGGTSPNDVPVTSIDWCDAFAFCKWAGKRLCGAPDGGSASFYDYAEPYADEWYFACSRDGGLAYPYGPSYIGANCNDVDYDAHGPVRVKQTPQCQGGYPGLYDMAGNIWEWEDSCDDAGGKNDRCRARGGSFIDGVDPTRCAFDTFQHFSPTRSYVAGFLGFRCCYP
jgi:formylglycine-generating enzyme required for sulfatase activity